MFCKKVLTVLCIAIAIENAAIAMPADTVELPFFDDFSYNLQFPDQNLWDNVGVTISKTMPYNQENFIQPQIIALFLLVILSHQNQ